MENGSGTSIYSVDSEGVLQMLQNPNITYDEVRQSLMDVNGTVHSCLMETLMNLPPMEKRRLSIRFKPLADILLVNKEEEEAEEEVKEKQEEQEDITVLSKMEDMSRQQESDHVFEQTADIKEHEEEAVVVMLPQQKDTDDDGEKTIITVDHINEAILREEEEEKEEEESVQVPLSEEKKELNKVQESEAVKKPRVLISERKLRRLKKTRSDGDRCSINLQYLAVGDEQIVYGTQETLRMKLRLCKEARPIAPLNQFIYERCVKQNRHVDEELERFTRTPQKSVLSYMEEGDLERVEELEEFLARWMKGVDTAIHSRDECLKCHKRKSGISSNKVHKANGLRTFENCVWSCFSDTCDLKCTRINTGYAGNTYCKYLSFRHGTGFDRERNIKCQLVDFMAVNCFGLNYENVVLHKAEKGDASLTKLFCDHSLYPVDNEHKYGYRLGRRFHAESRSKFNYGSTDFVYELVSFLHIMKAVDEITHPYTYDLIVSCLFDVVIVRYEVLAIESGRQALFPSNRSVKADFKYIYSNIHSEQEKHMIVGPFITLPRSDMAYFKDVEFCGRGKEEAALSSYFKKTLEPERFCFLVSYMKKVDGLHFSHSDVKENQDITEVGDNKQTTIVSKVYRASVNECLKELLGSHGSFLTYAITTFNLDHPEYVEYMKTPATSDHLNIFALLQTKAKKAAVLNLLIDLTPYLDQVGDIKEFWVYPKYSQSQRFNLLRLEGELRIRHLFHVDMEHVKNLASAQSLFRYKVPTGYACAVIFELNYVDDCVGSPRKQDTNVTKRTSSRIYEYDIGEAEEERKQTEGRKEREEERKKHVFTDVERYKYEKLYYLQAYKRSDHSAPSLSQFLNVPFPKQEYFVYETDVRGKLYFTRKQRKFSKTLLYQCKRIFVLLLER